MEIDYRYNDDISAVEWRWVIEYDCWYDTEHDDRYDDCGDDATNYNNARNDNDDGWWCY